MADPATTLPGLMFVGAVFLLTIFLSLNYKSWWISIFIFIFLFILCLVTDTGLSRIDYNFIFPPAWRLLHGYGLNQTFSIYEHFLSILTAVWIKFFPIGTLPLLGRFSYFALFFGTYFFARNLFNNKQLACYLLISLVIVKIYGNLLPPDAIMQVTPWRLDWWIVLLALAYWKTTHHWIIGASLGLLIIFHHSFGCIYTISYFIFILMLIFFKRSFSLYFRNLIIVVIAFLLYGIFLHPQLDMALFYQKTGMGFLRITRQSFYWYMPVIFATTFLLICKNRSLLSQRFFETSILLLSLAIGNSMYFFGRSHENNIINIAGVLLTVFFLFLDLIDVELKQLTSKKFSRGAVPLMACAVILAISYQYADRAIKLVHTQFSNLKDHRFISDSFSDFESLDFSKLRTLTNSSPKVIFVSQQDFYFYYFGGYALPQDYRCYTCSWFIMKNYINYLNDQLKKGFYIVINPQEMSAQRDIINALNARYFSNTSDLLVISNNPMRNFDKTLWYRS